MKLLINKFSVNLNNIMLFNDIKHLIGNYIKVKLIISKIANINYTKEELEVNIKTFLNN